ncbi:PQQ-binding-like beta-propeller repeat protein [Actinomadura sp. WMMA1423]|uniref:outer membrane protein assembly factor BamB family protein n=1 Tax=Actinomadura sp. WMMA1423 TaxID=2591108 RepID=UPI0011477CA2|nr:PQQ-binding-like beta-propeller repeat protein [Actinomadura sp. WMMA1423]
MKPRAKILHPARLGRALLAVLVVIAVVAASLLVRRHIHHGSGDQRAGSSPADAKGTGVVPGDLVRVWSVPSSSGMPVGFDARSHTMFLWDSSGGNALTPHRLTAIDSRSGKTRWETATDQWDINVDYLPEDFVRGNTVVVEAQDPAGAQFVVGLDVVTGSVRWKQQRPEEYAEIGVGDAVVAVQTDQDTLKGVSTDSGELLWEWSAAPGCVLVSTKASESLLGARERCGTTGRAVALDPSNGRVRWRQPTGTGSEGEDDPGPNWEIRGSLMFFWAGQRITAYSGSGRRVFDRQSGSTCASETCFAANSDVAVIAYNDAATKSDPAGTNNVVQAVGLRDGRTLWRHVLQVERVVIVGGYAYVTGRLSSPLLPPAFGRIDIGTGRYSVVAAPQFDLSSALIGIDGATVVSGETLGSERTSAFRAAGPPRGVLGGAPAAQWPDACALLDGGKLASTMRGFTYRAVPIRASGTGLSRPVTCQYIPKPTSGPTVEVSVGWVASDRRQATDVIHGITSGRPLAGIGDNAVRIDPGEGGVEQAELAVQVGRYVVYIHVVREPDAASKIGRDVALRLRKLPA